MEIADRSFVSHALYTNLFILMHFTYLFEYVVGLYTVFQLSRGEGTYSKRYINTNAIERGV